MISTQYINLDLTIPYRQVIYSKTGDTNRYVEITLFNGGEAWDVPSGASGSCYATDCWGNHFSSSSVSYEDNVATVKLPTISSIGTCSAELKITQGQSVSTFNFYIDVYESA